MSEGTNDRLLLLERIIDDEVYSVRCPHPFQERYAQLDLDGSLLVEVVVVNTY
jgi:hypothetical protein